MTTLCFLALMFSKVKIGGTVLSSLSTEKGECAYSISFKKNHETLMSLKRKEKNQFFFYFLVLPHCPLHLQASGIEFKYMQRLHYGL